MGATQVLLDFKGNVNPRGEYGRTPLIMAAFNGQPTVAHLLVSRGADVNAQNEMKKGAGDGQTPLHQAVRQGRLEVVRVLTQSPQLNVLKNDIYGFSPIYYAFEAGLLDILDLLLNHPSWADPKDLNNPNRLDNLLKVSCWENTGEVVKIVKHKQRELFLHTKGEDLRKEKMQKIKVEVKKFRQVRAEQLKSNGVSRAQRSRRVDHETKIKEKELIDKMEKEIQEELKEIINKRDGKQKERVT